MRSERAMTLIELLVSVVICALIFGVIFFMLRSSLDIYNLAQEELFTRDVLDKTTLEITEGSVSSYGIKDALEIIQAKETSLMFIPPWTDDSHRPPLRAGGEEYLLNRPFRSGAPFPIAEVRNKGEAYFRSPPATFIYGPNNGAGNLDDRIVFAEAPPGDAELRVVYWPDHTWFPDTIMNIEWDGEERRFRRTYRGETDYLPPRRQGKFQIKEAKFEYFDNTGYEIIPEGKSGFIPADKLNLITACRLITFAGEARRRECFSFANIRNTRVFGSGLIIRKGTTFRIPNSRHIRTFTLSNIVGARNGDIIEIEAEPEEGRSWKVRIELALKEGRPLIHSYRIEYPAGSIVYSETLDRSVNFGLNFLTLGGNGRYDYDYDEDVENVVNLASDEVKLSIRRMDPGGAALLIRP